MTGFNVKIEGDKALRERFDGMPEAVRVALLAKTTELAMKLQAKVVSEKLSGQVLRRVTGKLARSIFNKVEDQDGRIVGVVASSGEVLYAKAHEFGFAGSENVRAHTRTIKEAFGRELSEAKTVAVRAFVRQANIPERSFLRSSLAELRPEIETGLKQAILQALEGK